jgi:hypothetical protein
VSGLFVARYDETGNYLWSMAPTVSGDNFGSCVRSGNDDAIIFGWLDGSMDFGGSTLTTSGQNLFVAKLDGAGNHIWSQTFGSANNKIYYSNGVVDVGGNVWLTLQVYDVIDFGQGSLGTASQWSLVLLELDASGQPSLSKVLLP